MTLDSGTEMTNLFFKVSDGVRLDGGLACFLPTIVPNTFYNLIHTNINIVVSGNINYTYPISIMVKYCR